MMTIDPSLPFAAQVNQMIDEQSSLSIGQLYNEQRSAYPGDPMVGKVIPGTSIKWVDATEVQGTIWLYYEEHGLQIPKDMQAILDTNRGPESPWNLSYAGWGLVPGEPPSQALKFVTGVEVKTGQMETVITV